MQHSKKKFLNAAYDCVTSSSDPVVIRAHKQASDAIHKGMLQASAPSRASLAESAGAAGVAPAGGNGTQRSAGFVLITQFYFPEDLTLRQNIQNVLIRNLENSAIDEIYLICEEEYSFEQLPNYHKITKFLLKSRLQFADALRVANSRLAGRSVILANSDIYFDRSLPEFIAEQPLPLAPRLLLALSTWTPGPSTQAQSQPLSLHLRSDSQDAWLLTAPVSEEIIQQTDFFFGLPRCDNRIAKIFMNSGYRYYIRPYIMLY